MNQLEAVELSNLYLEKENMHIQLKVQLNSEYTLTFDKYQLLVIERHSKTEQTFPLRLLDSVDRKSVV